VGDGRLGGAPAPAAPARAARWRPDVWKLADLAPALEGLRERHLIGVLEIAADRKAARDPRQTHAQRAKELGEIERRGLALYVGIRGQDHLGDRAALQPRQELAHLQIVRADAVEAREPAQ